MAKSNKGKNSPTYVSNESAKLADIYTASKAAMEAVDYSSGFPAQDGVLRQGVWQGRLLGKKGE